MTTTDPDVYYDPYDFEIDSDPYPIWKRLRDEMPLYYNETYDFYAVSRFEDVEQGLVNWKTYSSAQGTLLELIKSDFEIPPGSIIFEDPPGHNLHRGLLSRVFTPRKMNAIEPKVREFCARSLDPLVGGGGFDFIADLGAQMPMRTIGMLLGIPEQDQEEIRDSIDDGLRLEDGTMPEPASFGADGQASSFDAYIDWRAEHPSDDLMTELLQAEFEDETGTTRRLSRPEVVNLINLLAAAGNETTTRLIGWTGKVLADHPERAGQAGRGPHPGAERHRGAPSLRVTVTGPGPLRDRGRRAPRPDSAGRERHSPAQRIGQPRRAQVPRRGPLRRQPGRSTTTWPSATASTSAWGRHWPGWRAGWPSTRSCNASPPGRSTGTSAKQARTSTVRGWERLPVATSPDAPCSNHASRAKDG